uniref:NYN domain-containing protein n=1 Tax=Noccaea caerulescens TaxID=107243 RepID=A0A1J3I0R3_NOCCA
MSTDSSVGKTGVFWDVDDFPFPQGRGIRKIVESILEKQGYETEVSIRVYGGEHQFTTEFADRHRFTFVKRSDKYSRLNKMLVDIGLWVLDAPKHTPLPRNVVVVAKNIKEQTEYVRYLENLNSIGFNVLVVVPDDVKPEEVNIPSVKMAWYWKDLQDLGNPIPGAEYQTLLSRGERNEILFDPDDCSEDYASEDADDDDRGEDDAVCYRCMHY